MEEPVTNSDSLQRIADAVVAIAAGAGKPLLGKGYDFSSDDGVRAAVADIARSLGAEVTRA